MRKSLREVMFRAWFAAGWAYGDRPLTTKIRMYIEDRYSVLWGEECS